MKRRIEKGCDYNDKIITNFGTDALANPLGERLVRPNSLAYLFVGLVDDDFYDWLTLRHRHTALCTKAIISLK